MHRITTDAPPERLTPATLADAGITEADHKGQYQRLCGDRSEAPLPIAAVCDAFAEYLTEAEAMLGDDGD